MARNPFEPTGVTLTFTLDSLATFEFYYIDLTPPSVDGGDPISTTLLATTDFHTKMAPELKDIGNIQFTAEYQPDVILTAPYGQPGNIAIYFPGQGTMTFRGYLKNFNPDSLKPGERSQGSGEFVVTNTANDGFTPQLPTWTAGTGLTSVVTFHYEGGGPQVVTQKTVVEGATYGTLPVPTKVGYTFDGWFTAETAGTEVTSASTVPAGADHTIYAQWTVV